MKPRITVITICVDDLETSLRFYQDGLGFSTPGIVGSKYEHGAGAFIVKPAQNTFWGGYAGYFQDPDQHLWEIVWNPDWEI